MIECNNGYHCLTCQRDRHAKFFMLWISDKTKSRRCDSCQDDPIVKKRLENSKAERKAKPLVTRNTPIFEGLSKAQESINKCKVRQDIDDIKTQKEIDDFVGL